MCRFKFRPVLALLTFVIGVLGVSIWFAKSNDPQTVIEKTKQPEREIRGFTDVISVEDGSSVTSTQESIEPEVLRSVPSETVDDIELEAAIRSVIEIEDFEERDARYYYNRVDLNGDKKPEVIVFLFGKSMCGSSGCDALLFQKVSGKYKLITHFEPARNPIIVSQTKTNGWQDLIFFNAGGGVIPDYSCSQFNGKTYLDNPTVEKGSPPLKTRIKGVAYFVGEYSDNFGLRFRFRK